MLISIHPTHPEERKIKEVISCLLDGGVIAYPTDTIYGLGADVRNQDAIIRICRIKGIKPEKANLSFVCSDLSHISEYTRPISSEVFKLMKRNLPGPFTFILPASNNIPKMLKNNKKTIGIRVPDHPLARKIIAELDSPIISTSLKHPDDDFMEYMTDPIDIHDAYGNIVDMVIDCGMGGMIPSTIVDCTSGEPFVSRQGAGELIY